jgi:amino acid transporter
MSTSSVGHAADHAPSNTSSGVAAAGGLRRNYLSFSEVAAQSVGTIAPSGTPALVVPVVFATAGNGTWLAYAFATVALLIVSIQINVFSRRIASPGALYLYAAHGFGPLVGVIAGWSLVIGYVFTGAAVINGFVNYANVLIHELGIGGADAALTLILSVVGLAAAWWLGYRDIRLSTRTTLGIEIATVLLILVVVLGHIFGSGHIADPEQLSLAGVDAEQLRLGLVLAFFSFVGFESATALGHEARQPLRVIPRAVITSTLAVGLVFIVSAYGLVDAFHGLDPTLDKSEAPLTTVAQQIGIGGIGVLISAGVALSFFACILGSINAGARVLYALAHHGLFHSAARGTHESNATPHVAVTIVSLIALALSLGLTLVGYPLLEAYGYLGTIATYGFLFAYVLVAVGAPVFLRRRGELRPVHIVTAVAATLLLALPLIGSVYPVPAWPFNLLPVIFLALLGAGVGYFLYVRSADPERLRAIENDLLGSPAEQRPSA